MREEFGYEDIPLLKSESEPELRRETEFGYKVVPIQKREPGPELRSERTIRL